jgi:hypothetical protein
MGWTMKIDRQLAVSPSPLAAFDIAAMPSLSPNFITSHSSKWLFYNRFPFSIILYAFHFFFRPSLLDFAVRVILGDF